MSQHSHLGHSTIIVSWVATSLAFASLGVTTGSNVLSGRSFALADWLIYIAFLIGVLLVAQNTWAIINEGQASHQNDLTNSRTDVLARVCLGLSSCLTTI
jgi:hypothetical protein